jgi:hypothetical protein
MNKVYAIDGHQVLVTRTYRTGAEGVSAVVHTLQLDGQPLAASIGKTRLGQFWVNDDRGRRIGTFPSLQAAVKGVLRVD